jgi:hypothetical protein
MISYISRVGIQPLLSAKGAADVLLPGEPPLFLPEPKTALFGYVV